MAESFPQGLYEYQLYTIIVADNRISQICTDVSRTGDTVSINFNNTLSPSETAALADIIANYVYIPPPVSPDLIIKDGVIQSQVENTKFTLLGNQPNEIHISKTSQTHYPTIKAALLANNNPNLIFIVHPGVYVEDNPLVLPQGCYLFAQGHAENTSIIAQNPNSDLIILGLKCQLEGFSLIGANGTGSRGIYFDGSQSGGMGALSAVFENYILDCNIGIESDGKGLTQGADTIYIRESKIATTAGNLNRGIYCHSGGQFISSGLFINGIPGYFTINDAIYCTGEGSKVSLTTSSVWYCNNAVQINNGGEVELSLFTTQYNNTAVLFGAMGTTSKINASLLNLQNSINYDINILSTKANIGIQSGNIDPRKINNPNSVNINARFTSNQFNSYAHDTTGQVNFGNKAIPTSVAMGQGNYDIDVNVFTNNNLEVGTWTDCTQAAITEVTVPFNLFQNVNSNNCIYFGRNDNPVGLYIHIITPTNNVTEKNDLVWEYWTGTHWTSFTVWQSDTIIPYYTMGNSFISNTGTYHIRFGIKSTTPIVAKSLNGQNRYWVRCRIVNDISSIPVAQFCKFHVNTVQIDRDGFQETFGDSRSSTILPHWDQKLMSASTNPLSNIGLFVSEKLGFISDNAVFPDNSLSRVGINGFIPKDADLSFPVKIEVSLVGDNANTGNINLIARWNRTSEGSNIYLGGTGAPSISTDEKSQSILIPISNSGIEARGIFYLDFSHVVTNPQNGKPDLIWLSIERDATISNNADTYSGNAIVMQYNVSYIRMYIGGHLLSY